MNSNRIWGIGTVLVAAILWGTTGTAATFAANVGPLAIGAASLGVGGILQALVALPALARSLLDLRARWGIVAIGAVAVFVYPLAFYSSMHFAGVAIGTVSSLASAPVASGLLERIIEKRRLGGWWFLAALLSITGSILLVGANGGNHAAEEHHIIGGIGLGLVAGVSYAAYSWAAQYLMAQQIGRAAAMGSIFGVGGLLLMPVLLVTGAPLLANSVSLAVGVYMACVPMFLGYLAFGYGLSKIPASSATTITLVEPAVATLLAVWIVQEHLTLGSWIGLAIFGVVLIVLALAPSSRPQTSRGLLASKDYDSMLTECQSGARTGACQGTELSQ